MRIHHVGAVVRSIEEALPYYVAALGLKPETPIVDDPTQKARVVMLADPGGGPGYELVEPLGADSPLAPQARRGSNPAHTAFEVVDLDAELVRFASLGAMIVQAPAPALLFGGARVAFVFLRTRDLIELVEVEATGPGGWRVRASLA
jgi:methylmalonyl-CoA/ethylmalonyl-CoA epimerase